MKIGRKNVFLLFLLASIVLMGCGYKAPQTSIKKTKDNTEQISENEDNKVIITVGDKEFNAVFYKNETTDALIAKLPVTVSMKDLNSNEKYYYFDEAFPKNSQKVESINAGDIMLYGDSCVVLFYKSFNTSYSYTKIGYIENIEGLESALGNSDIDVTFKIDEGENL